MPSSAVPAAVRRPIPPADAPGRLGQAVLKVLAREVRVDAVHALSPRFRLVCLRGDALGRGAVAPGDKLQVRVAGLAFRTWTPFRLDAAADGVAVLGLAHGDTPAARWLQGVAPGDACHVLGPRRSLPLGAIERSTVFVGDETSLGLALALCDTPLGGLDTHFIFEVADVAEVRGVLDTLGRGMLRNAWLVPRQPDDAHLDAVDAALARYAGADAFRQYVLSGRSLTIQRLQRTLRGAGAKASQTLAKAYWAPGKIALD